MQQVLPHAAGHCDQGAQKLGRKVEEGRGGGDALFSSSIVFYSSQPARCSGLVALETSRSPPSLISHAFFPLTVPHQGGGGGGGAVRDYSTFCRQGRQGSKIYI